MKTLFSFLLSIALITPAHAASTTVGKLYELNVSSKLRNKIKNAVTDLEEYSGATSSGAYLIRARALNTLQKAFKVCQQEAAKEPTTQVILNEVPRYQQAQNTIQNLIGLHNQDNVSLAPSMQKLAHQLSEIHSELVQ